MLKKPMLRSHRTGRTSGDLRLFATSATSELREPLRVAHAYGELLLRTPGTLATGVARAHVERMISTAAQMQTLLNDLHARTAAPSLTLMS